VFAGSVLSDENGIFNLESINGSASNYKLKLVYYNSSGIATKVGVSLPPFPAEIYYPASVKPGTLEFMKPPSLNGTTFYLQGAATLNITATNGSDSQKFGYEIIDKASGFPIESSIQNSVRSKEVVVPIGRDYTVMTLRDPSSFTSYPIICDGNFMNDTACPTPPQSNSSLGSLVQGQVLDVIMDLRTTDARLEGCIFVHGNSSEINITKIIPKLIPWPGFVPPMSADDGSINVSADVNYTYDCGTDGIGFYNISLMGSTSGVDYLIEFYGKNGSTDADVGGDYWAMFQNITIYNTSSPGRYNITLSKLLGNYDTSSAWNGVNTSKYKINFQNSSGGAVVTDMHVDLKVKHPVFGTLHYIIEDLSSGFGYIALLNDTTWAKALVYPNGPPMEKTLNLSTFETNITIDVSNGFGFRKPNATGDIEEVNLSNLPIKLSFWRNSDECNDINSSASSCEITSMDANNFNPLKAMLAGKVNLKLSMVNTNTTLTYINFDMFSAKPPTNSIFNENASSTATNQEVWEFGSFTPPETYDYVVIQIPYSESNLNEDRPIKLAIPALYDENWDVIWNRTAGYTESNLTDDYLDYNTKPYAAYINGTEQTCSKIDPNLNSTICYVNTSSNFVYMQIPHFSGVGPTVSTSAASSVTTSAGGGGSGTAEVDEGVSVVRAISIEEGETVLLSTADKGSFTLKGVKHTVDVKSIIEDKVTLTISSNPVTITLGVKERKEVDVDGNGLNDLFIRLDAIVDNKAKLYFKEIKEKISEEVANETAGEEVTEEVAKEKFVSKVGELVPGKSKSFWIVGGIVLLLLIGVVVYFVRKRSY
jgi:hypothetical protein